MWLHTAQRFSGREFGVEGGTAAALAALEATFEPRDALRAGAVSPGLRADGTAGHFLEVIVADRGRGLQRSGNVIGVDDVPLLGAMSPDTGEAIGLQLQIHGERILVVLVLR